MEVQFFIPIVALLYLHIIETEAMSRDAALAKETTTDFRVVCEGEMQIVGVHSSFPLEHFKTHLQIIFVQC